MGRPKTHLGGGRASGSISLKSMRGRGRVRRRRGMGMWLGNCLELAQADLETRVGTELYMGDVTDDGMQLG